MLVAAIEQHGYYDGRFTGRIRDAMRILVTGAFGNIGWSTVQELSRQGHTVRCFGHRTRSRERAGQTLGTNVELAWGDIRLVEDLVPAVQEQDAIVHLAYVLPPESEEHPDRARAINVIGTRVLIDAARRTPRPPSFLFASSFDVFGFTQDQPAPRRVVDPVQATDHYSGHKLECEEMVRASGLAWTIFRFADVPPLTARQPHPIMFRIPLDTRFEVVHTRDAGLAIANAFAAPEVWGKIWLIGGGRTCQVRYRDYLGRMLDVMGIGRLPDNAFGHEPYCTDWLDTEESQRILAYQRHSFEEVIDDVARGIGVTRFLARPFGPLVRRWILRMSPYR